MSGYRNEWPCCGDETYTEAWEPERCPFCELNDAKDRIAELETELQAARATDAEPVAELLTDEYGEERMQWLTGRNLPDGTKFYTHPPAGSQGVPEEWREVLEGCVSCFNCPEWSDSCEEVEAKARALLSTSPGNGWVRCEDRLPTEDDADIFGNVWCSGFWDNPKRGIAPIKWANIGKGNAGDTHWMPTGLKRPQPPVNGGPDSE